MAADHRRARGTLVDPVTVGFEVERSSRERFKTMAADSQLSAAALFELVVDHLEAEQKAGRTPWLPEKDRTEELPIDGP
ncbi:hypothetical protein [Curtobacterium poinsettiae]|uniref:hypothetical protein n=1 Tax=Curtobacterium poinsettiae TaxID=159612 RepID=UPI001BDF4A49|nr:hypothetical protein [Curtobacterium flaccumfaciens]MBT1611868.1 hypothetical protein [Curtobacterium flaccumfaciens pv. poinsettiae]